MPHGADPGRDEGARAGLPLILLKGDFPCNGAGAWRGFFPFLFAFPPRSRRMHPVITLTLSRKISDAEPPRRTRRRPGVPAQI
jgi:hypothetical protein